MRALSQDRPEASCANFVMLTGNTFQACIKHNASDIFPKW